jgi:hypothetical protein
MTSRLADIFDRAAELVEQGWCQGENYKTINGKPCCCAWGAAAQAYRETGVVGSLVEIDDVMTKAARAMGSERITNWNDSPERTQAEVVELLRRLAREQRELTNT